MPGRLHALQECMTLWAPHNIQTAKHVAKYENVRCLSVCIALLHNVVGPRFHSECSSARPPSQLQVEQEVAPLDAAGCVVPAQISGDKPNLHNNGGSRLCPGPGTAQSRDWSPTLFLQGDNHEIALSLTWHTQVQSALHECAPCEERRGHATGHELR